MPDPTPKTPLEVARDALEAARLEIMWWRDEHGCCAGRELVTLMKIVEAQAALAEVSAPPAAAPQPRPRWTCLEDMDAGELAAYEHGARQPPGRRPAPGVVAAAGRRAMADVQAVAQAPLTASDQTVLREALFASAKVLPEVSPPEGVREVALELPTCSHCGFPIRGSSGARHYGTHMAHQESECLRLLHAEIERLRTPLPQPSAEARDAARLPAGWALEIGVGGFSEDRWVCVRNLASQLGQDFYEDRDPLIFAFLAALAAPDGPQTGRHVLLRALADEVNGPTFMGEPVLPDRTPSPEPSAEARDAAIDALRHIVATLNWRAAALVTHDERRIEFANTELWRGVDLAQKALSEIDADLGGMQTPQPTEKE